MEIKFDNSLNFQQEAIQAVVDVFKGQEICNSNFTVYSPEYLATNGLFANQESTNLLGYANKLNLTDGQLLENIHAIQIAKGLKPSTKDEIKRDKLDLSIEMETGTGKTYVYLKTVLELNAQYGFSKFMIVVPTIPIKEGVYKNLQITEKHFKEHFANINYKFFVYDSSKLNEIRDFATSSQLQIMVINIQAFSKDLTVIEEDDSLEENEKQKKKKLILHNYNDRLGAKPITLLQDTRPIVIVDEPQRVLSTKQGKDSVANLKPLAILRYSATHKEKVNLIYKLDAVDAYELELVKQIEVASVSIDTHITDGAYIKLVSVSNKKGIAAKLELDIKNKESGVTDRIEKEVKKGDDLLQITRLPAYDNFMVRDIDATPEKEYIDFTNDKLLKLGESIGSMDDAVIKRAQIRKTIEEHLDKELVLNPRGIKVLSLFFIDKVANYRQYDEEGNQRNGIYAQVFEEEYQNIIKRAKYADLFKGVQDREIPVSQVHNGYFSTDKKAKKSNAKDKYDEMKDSNGSTKADEDTYNLIMKDKETLLSFESSLRFIFSHTALREGWDSPNVFQICTLKDSAGTPISRRQEIGRGLRLCVNQHGERVHGFSTNTLTVMVNEKYEDFVKNYQKELVFETGIKFGVIEDHSFMNIPLNDNYGEPGFFGLEKSKELWKHLLQKSYIGTDGKITETLKKALEDNTVELPYNLNKEVKERVLILLRTTAGKYKIKNNAEKKRIELNKQVLLSPEFENLWNRIKYKTTYSVNFDSEKLIAACAKSINDKIIVSRGKITYTKVGIKVDIGGVRAEEAQETYGQITEGPSVLPDIVTYLQNETKLTRKSIVEILKKCDNLDYFKLNPQKYIEGCIDIIREQMRLKIVDGIVYEKIGDDAFYEQALFENQELVGYLKNNMVESGKSPYQYVVCDSDVERNLAREFEKSSQIKLYAKLPGWFTIETPLGNYNPDWAVLFEKDSEEKLYFVVESKGTLEIGGLKPSEQGKIDCGIKHFEELSRQSGIDLKMFVTTDFENLVDKILS